MVDDDIATVLEAAGVGTRGSTIFAGRGAVVPPGDGPYLSFIVYGGGVPERIQNQLMPSAVKPSIQVIARAKNASAAITLAHAAYSALAVIRNKKINGVFYREIFPMQEPFDFNQDDEGRQCWIFNVAVAKQPS